jgi:hypothetical protein
MFYDAPEQRRDPGLVGAAGRQPGDRAADGGSGA